PGGSQAFVEVRVRTKTAAGNFILPPTFAQTFGGGTGGTTVGACARAAWSTPDQNPIAFALSLCEFLNLSNGRFTTPPNFRARDERVIFVHGGPGSSCTNSPPSGWESPGEFGWVDTLGTCRAVITGGTLDPSNGNNWGGCGDTGSGNGRLE